MTSLSLPGLQRETSGTLFGRPARGTHRPRSCRRARLRLESLEDRRLMTVAMGPPSMIQSTFGTPSHLGNFEAVVLEGTDLVHYSRDNGANGLPWHRAEVITTQATGQGSIVQCGNDLEVVVPEGNNLVQFQLDETIPNSPWQQVATICTDATGPASLIKLSNGTLEVAALEGTSVVCLEQLRRLAPRFAQ